MQAVCSVNAAQGLALGDVVKPTMNAIAGLIKRKRLAYQLTAALELWSGPRLLL